MLAVRMPISDLRDKQESGAPQLHAGILILAGETSFDKIDLGDWDWV